MADLREASMGFGMVRHGALPLHQSRSRINFNDVVQLPKLMGFDVLVVRIGHPLTVYDQAIQITAGIQLKLCDELAGPAGSLHSQGLVRPGVEIAGDGDGRGLLEFSRKKNLAADLLDSVE